MQSVPEVSPVSAVEDVRRCGDDDEPEAIAEFNQEHHAGGLNAKFFASAESLREKFGGPKGIFDSPEREIVCHADRIFDTFAEYGGLVHRSFEGLRVLDVGAGTGVLDCVLSRRVGATGVVFASDLSPGFVELLRGLQLPHANVIPVLGTDKDVQTAEAASSAGGETASMPIAAESLDAVFMCDVYHHFEFPRTMMRAIRRLLKPDVGRFLLVDFHRDPSRMVSHPPQWALDHIRADKGTFVAEIESCGFKLVMDKDIDELRENYLLSFTLA